MSHENPYQPPQTGKGGIHPISRINRHALFGGPLHASQRWRMISAVAVSSLAIPPVYIACNVAFQYASGAVSPRIIFSYAIFSLACSFFFTHPLCIALGYFLLISFITQVSLSTTSRIVRQPMSWAIASATVSGIVSTTILWVQLADSVAVSTFLPKLAFIVVRDAFSVGISTVFYAIIIRSFSIPV